MTTIMLLEAGRELAGPAPRRRPALLAPAVAALRRLLEQLEGLQVDNARARLSLVRHRRPDGHRQHAAHRKSRLGAPLLRR